MSLVRLPKELYCQVVRRLDSDDEALKGFDEQTNEYSRALREKYERYRREVGNVLRNLTPDNVMKELHVARTRERAFKGVQVALSLDQINEILAAFVRHWSGDRFATAIQTLINDPNFELRWEAPALHLRVNSKTIYEFETPEQNVLRFGCNRWPRLNDIECDIDQFTDEQQAIKQFHRAFSQRMVTSDIRPTRQKQMLRDLLVNSSLFLCTECCFCFLGLSAQDKDAIDRLKAMSIEFWYYPNQLAFTIDFALHPDALELCKQLGELSINFRTYYNYRMR